MFQKIRNLIVKTSLNHYSSFNLAKQSTVTEEAFFSLLAMNKIELSPGDKLKLAKMS